jgi:hypothetical protein
MPIINLEQKLQLALRIASLRTELAALEVEFAGGPVGSPPKPRASAKASGGPSISERVLNVITEAGAEGISRRDLLIVLPHGDAVHSALKVHSRAGRIYSSGGKWVRDAKSRPTRQMQVVVAPVEASGAS